MYLMSKCLKLLGFRNLKHLRHMSTCPRNVCDVSSAEFKSFLNSFDTVLTDCDGVLWNKNDVINKAELVVNIFRQIGKKVHFVTNNSTRTRMDLLTKCQALGFEAILDDIVSVSYLVAKYLNELNFSKKVYVIGSPGLLKELDEFNIGHVGGAPDILTNDYPSYIATKFSLDPDVGAVVIGFDEHFSYPKMLKAASYLANPECLFVATNTDERAQVNDRLVIPCTGSIVKCIETCSERSAFCVGKPNEYIKRAVIDERGVDPTRTLMIGDRCSIDILFGSRCHFQTLLVLTGVSTLEHVKQYSVSESEMVPHQFAPSLGHLLPLLVSATNS